MRKMCDYGTFAHLSFKLSAISRWYKLTSLVQTRVVDFGLLQKKFNHRTSTLVGQRLTCPEARSEP